MDYFCVSPQFFEPQSIFMILIATHELCFLDAYNSSRLISLDKCPGVRPIGVGEVMRRIIGRAIVTCVKNDLKFLGGNLQLCLGQRCGIEHAIHSLREAFEQPETQAILLIDAKNAFNSLNRDLALKNIEVLCPSLYLALSNSYKTPSNLYVSHKVLQSREGTTQGDPLAMAMYGLAILPLIEKVSDDNLIQKWYADDGNAAGSVEALKVLLSNLKLHGPSFGYNVIKCHLITKAEVVSDAKNVFKGEEVDIIDGSRVLGSVIGNVDSCRQYIEDQKQNYLRILQKLTKHAKIAPQNVYKCLTNSVQQKLTFLSRTTPDTFDLLEEAEKVINDHLIPNLVCNTNYDETYRDIFSLPVREGGLNIIRSEDRILEYERSKTISEQLSLWDVSNVESEQLKRIEKIRKDKSVKMIESLDLLSETWTPADNT